MKTVIFQILTLLSLFSVLVSLEILIRKQEKMTEKAGRDVWYIKCKRTSESTRGILKKILFLKHGKETIALEEGTYYIGHNAICNDIVLKTNEKIRMYLNITSKKVLVTILKGKIHIGGYTYYPDASKQIIIREHENVFINDHKLIFKKKEGEW